MKNSYTSAHIHCYSKVLTAFRNAQTIEELNTASAEHQREINILKKLNKRFPLYTGYITLRQNYDYYRKLLIKP